mmetsp:Transcript_30063/g.62077  ORF Transcript_30063/g.62077 Transcript_30063/m.62077 type:complete len:117 (-) Transcript_30063:320-670(-)
MTTRMIFILPSEDINLIPPSNQHFLALFGFVGIHLSANATRSSASSSVYLGPEQKSNKMDDVAPAAAAAAILAVAVLAFSSSVISSLDRFLLAGKKLAKLDKPRSASNDGAAHDNA